MHPLKSGELHIDARALAPDRFLLEWKGRSTNRYPGEDLQPFLVEVLAEAQGAHAAIEMHFESLEYFNSSTVAVLVQFIRSACAEKVPIKFTYAADVRWQRLSFDALQVFSLMDHNVEVTAVGPAPANGAVPRRN